MTQVLRKRLFWLCAACLFVLVYVLMAPSAPNTPAPPEQRDSVGRTAY